MINALSQGAPPHGGIAPGIDRIVMLLANEANIREVTMFPMNQNAQDLMMMAPSEVNAEQLEELQLSITKKKQLFFTLKIYPDIRQVYKFSFIIISYKTLAGDIFYNFY